MPATPARRKSPAPSGRVVCHALISILPCSVYLGYAARRVRDQSYHRPIAFGSWAGKDGIGFVEVWTEAIAVQCDVAVEMLLQNRPPNSCSQQHLHVDSKQACCTSPVATGQKSRMRVVGGHCALHARHRCRCRRLIPNRVLG